MLTRREFVARTSLAAAGSLVFHAGAVRAAQNWQEPELLVLNAKIYTGSPAMPMADAIAVRDGRFVAVGRNDEIKPLAGRRTRVIDAARQTMVPGFIDCHNHAPGNVLLYEVLVGNPYDVEFVTIDGIIEKLRRRRKLRRLIPG